MPSLTPAERGLITRVQNHLKTVDYQSASGTYIHNLLLIIERLTQPEKPIHLHGRDAEMLLDSLKRELSK